MMKHTNPEHPTTNLIITADHSRLDLVTTLLDDGADPNAVDSVGTSALHNAAQRGHWHIARLLLERKTSARIQDANNAIPLHHAVRANQVKIVKLLLECDLETCDFQRKLCYRPLHVAASFGNAEIVQLLLDHGATTLIPNSTDTPLHLAARKGHQNVCEIQLQHDRALRRSLWERMVGPRLEVDTVGFDGCAPLALAVYGGHHRTVEVFFCSLTVSWAARGGDKKFLFHEAVEKGNCEMVRMFLNHGEDVNVKGDQGRRGVHLAARGSNVEMIRPLHERCAEGDVKDKYGDTPEYYTNDPKIVMILRNHVKTQSSESPVLGTAPPPSKYTPRRSDKNYQKSES